MKFEQLQHSREDDEIHSELYPFGIDILELSIELSSYLSKSHTKGKSVACSNSSDRLPCTKKINNITNRMRNRRKREGDDPRKPRKPGGGGKEDDYSLIFRNRRISMMAYAIDLVTNQIYVGYSGAGSPVVNWYVNQNNQDIREYRLRDYIGNVQQVTDFDPYNCAEVSALNVALSHGSVIGNLFFISMDTNGNLRAPCENCKQWIENYAYGYLIP